VVFKASGFEFVNQGGLVPFVSYLFFIVVSLHYFGTEICSAVLILGFFSLEYLSFQLTCQRLIGLGSSRQGPSGLSPESFLGLLRT
jgi:hypothetical protein